MSIKYVSDVKTSGTIVTGAGSFGVVDGVIEVTVGDGKDYSSLASWGFKSVSTETVPVAKVISQPVVAAPVAEVATSDQATS